MKVELAALGHGDEVGPVPASAEQDHVGVLASALLQQVVLEPMLLEQLVNRAVAVGHEEELLDPALLLPLAEPRLLDRLVGPGLHLLGPLPVEDAAPGVGP
jgi:hypothetical protein